MAQSKYFPECEFFNFSEKKNILTLLKIKIKKIKAQRTKCGGTKPKSKQLNFNSTIFYRHAGSVRITRYHQNISTVFFLSFQFARDYIFWLNRFIFFCFIFIKNQWLVFRIILSKMKTNEQLFSSLFLVIIYDDDATNSIKKNGNIHINVFG